MKPTARILAVALVAGAIGAVAGLWLNGPGPLLRSELGQRVLQGAMSASTPKPPAGLVIAERGQPMPPLRLPVLDGRTVDLPAAHAGRPLVINVWASWCGPCVREMPELDRFAATQGANGAQVVGIALDDADAVREFLQRVPVHYPILVDQAGPRDAGVRLGNPKGLLPYSVLIGADGRVLKQKLGPFEPGEIDDWAAR
jgi:thiol-disulfide isomerase/thioredoxin